MNENLFTSPSDIQPINALKTSTFKHFKRFVVKQSRLLELGQLFIKTKINIKPINDAFQGQCIQQLLFENT